jgi:polyisoprenoid-binding protein YceI
MRVSCLPSLVLTSLIFAASSCGSGVQSDQAQVGDAVEAAAIADSAERYQIDTTQSEVRWVGSKVTGRHPGTIDIQDGSLAVEDDRIVGGRFVMDMNTILVRDENMDAESNVKLTNHLKSGDFFEVDQHPTATFEITAVEPITTASAEAQDTDTEYTQFRDYSEFRLANPTHMVSGNLTMKGETKSITFPARISLENGEVQAKANFNINRTDWNLTYRSDRSVGDKLIYSDVNLGFDIVAKK